MKERIRISNKYGEMLVGILDGAGSKQLVILCHGLHSSKDDNILVNLASAIANKGISVFRFDFAGNGESEGQFLYGNYWKEAEDLRSVIIYFRGKEFKVNTIIGHSKGGNAVLLYASKYKDIDTVINISARYALDRGIRGRLGKDYEDRLKQYGFIDVKDRSGNMLYRVTKESLMDRLRTDMKAAALAIGKDCRYEWISGASDESVRSLHRKSSESCSETPRLHDYDWCYQWEHPAQGIYVGAGALKNLIYSNTNGIS